MVERIILFKLHDPSTRAELAARTLQALRDLPELDDVYVGTPADLAAEKSWDLSIVLSVDNVLLLDTLLESAPFKAYLEETMKDRYAVVKAWSFERHG